MRLLLGVACVIAGSLLVVSLAIVGFGLGLTVGTLMDLLMKLRTGKKPQRIVLRDGLRLARGERGELCLILPRRTYVIPRDLIE